MTAKRFRSCLLAAMFAAGLPLSGEEVWRFARPDATMSDGNRATMEAGAAVVEVLPARDRELAVLGVVKIAIDSHRLVSWVRQVEDLQRGTYIPLAHRFSVPPRLDDVRELTLDDQDLEDLRECRPGKCGVKLSASEIEQIRHVIAAAGPAWKGAAQTAFRRAIVRRAYAYMTEGLAGAAPYHDHKIPVSPDEEFAAISRNMTLNRLAPEMASALRSYPRVNDNNSESFLYWSKETLGNSKPIIAITHVSIFVPTNARGIETAVAFKQVYASHYLTASLSFTFLTRAHGSQQRYLVYTRDSRADVLGGAFAGIIRRMVERRIRSEAPPALDGFRRRLETEPTGELAPSS